MNDIINDLNLDKLNLKELTLMLKIVYEINNDFDKDNLEVI